jgi:biopolymer transport protein ExbD/biopolymer transport protein TolR
MNRILDTCLVALTMTTIPGAVFAQSGAVPLQRGVSVQQPVASNAATVPNADKEDALVVALTADGSVYLGGDRLAAPALADRVRSILSARNEKTLYIKADARVPYARLVEVLDAVWKSGIEGLTLLTAAQQDAPAQTNRPLSPKGLEMRLINE